MALAGTPAHLPDPAADGHLREEKIDSQELLKGNFLHAFRDTVRLPDGREASREYVRHPGAVMIIAQLDDGRLVLERQYRYPVQAVMLEFPAGKLDAGEASRPAHSANCWKKRVTPPDTGPRPVCCIR